MKYFIDDSAENMFFSLENSGMIDNKFISKPIHIDIHEQEEIDIKVPIIMKFINIILCNFIKKRKILLSFIGYEPMSLISLSFYILVYDV